MRFWGYMTERKLEERSDHTRGFFVFPENSGTSICTSVMVPCAQTHTHTHKFTCTVGESAPLCSPAVLSDCSVCWATAAVNPPTTLSHPKTHTPTYILYWSLLLHTHTHTDDTVQPGVNPGFSFAPSSPVFVLIIFFKFSLLTYSLI